MNIDTPADQLSAGQDLRAHIGALLLRHPDLTPEETAEVLRFLRKGPLVEVGLLTSDEALKDLLQRFRSDHQAAFALGMRDYLAIAALLVGVFLVCAYLWDWGVR